MLRDLLAGQRLLIVTEPGASVLGRQPGSPPRPADAGATVTGQIALQNKFFDTSDTTLDSLNQTNLDVAQHGRDLAGLPAETYQQQAAAGDRQRDPDQVGGIGDQPTSPVPYSPRAARQTAARRPCSRPTRISGFLTTTGQPDRPATLVVVVTPQNAPSDGTADPLDQVLVPLATELRGHSCGHRGGGHLGGFRAGQPDRGPAVEQRGQPGVDGRRRRPGVRADRGDPGARHAAARRQGGQLRADRQRRERRRSDAGAHAVRVSASPTPTPTPTTKKKAKK